MEFLYQTDKTNSMMIIHGKNHGRAKSPKRAYEFRGTEGGLEDALKINTGHYMAQIITEGYLAPVMGFYTVEVINNRWEEEDGFYMLTVKDSGPDGAHQVTEIVGAFKAPKQHVPFYSYNPPGKLVNPFDGPSLPAGAGN